MGQLHASQASVKMNADLLEETFDKLTKAKAKIDVLELAVKDESKQVGVLEREAEINQKECLMRGIQIGVTQRKTPQW